MQGFWSDKNWRLDGAALVLPNGQRIGLKEIVQWRSDLMVGQFDLTGRWPGWRVRQHWLIAPGGSMRRGRISEHHLRHLMQMHDWDLKDASRRQLVLFD
ncbi:MAG: hypothetical protein WA777_10735 [Rhodanobacter sp.]